MKRLGRDVVFDSAHRGEDLAKKSVRGGATTLAAQGMQFGISLVNTVILARLLTPGDFGLIGMVAAITGFAEMFKNAGLSMATINKDHITHEQISALFWLNLAISLILGLCLLVGSPLVAMFYGRPELTAVTAALSISFIISGLVIQHQALLNRHMMFSQLAILTVLVQLVNMGVSIVFACLGWHYWALVAGMFVSTLVSVFLTYFFCPWTPGWIRKSSGARKMLTFGGQLTVGNVSNYISMNMDNVLVGKYLGDVALGLYAKAYGLFLMPIVQFRNPMLNVAMPVLCALRGQPDRYAKYYLRIVNILATLVIPLALYCAIEADFLIRFFLGPQWTGAVGAFRILAVAGIIFPFKGVQGLLMVSMGYSTRWMYLEILYSVFYVISFVAGLQFGIEGVAIGVAIVSYLGVLASMFYCFHNSPVAGMQFVRVLVLPFFIGTLAMGSIVIIQCIWHDMSFIDHIMGLALFFGIYITVSSYRKTVRDTIKIFLRELGLYGKSRGMDSV